MIVTNSQADRDAIIGRRSCPDCGATAGQPCTSRFLEREMVNQVHPRRRKP